MRYQRVLQAKPEEKLKWVRGRRRRLKRRVSAKARNDLLKKLAREAKDAYLYSPASNIRDVRRGILSYIYELGYW